MKPSFPSLRSCDVCALCGDIFILFLASLEESTATNRILPLTAENIAGVVFVMKIPDSGRKVKHRSKKNKKKKKNTNTKHFLDKWVWRCVCKWNMERGIVSGKKDFHCCHTYLYLMVCMILWTDKQRQTEGQTVICVNCVYRSVCVSKTPCYWCKVLYFHSIWLVINLRRYGDQGRKRGDIRD